MLTKTYTDLYRAMSLDEGGMWLCEAGGQQTLVHQDFLRMYGIGMLDWFKCDVDAGGSILIRTIEKATTSIDF